MRSQRFGIEIEMTGITRTKAAQIIAGIFGGDTTHVGGNYDTYTARDQQGRQWKVMSDASIRCESGRGTDGGRAYSVEVVSPICTYDDIEKIPYLMESPFLKELLSAVRERTQR